MEGITLYSIDYYKKSVFKGSYRGMNFRISKDGDEEEKKLLATAWTVYTGKDKGEAGDDDV